MNNCDNNSQRTHSACMQKYGKRVIQRDLPAALVIMASLHYK